MAGRGSASAPDAAVTIRDVARAAGVSAMSVSRVVNGKPGVGPETAARIENAIQALGFRPNRMATSLRQKRGLSLLGMVVPDPYTPMFTEIAVAADAALREHGLIVVTASSGRDPVRERALVGSFIDRGLDGLLLVSEDDDHRYLAPELQRGRPVVFVGGPPVGVEAPAILVDNRGGARTAVEHLLGRGHRRIAIIASTTGFPAAERLAGYRQTLAAHGVPVDPALVMRVPHGRVDGARATARLVDRADPPTAIFCTNYLLTAGALPALRERGSGCAFVAFDDFEAATLAEPPVTVVTQDPPSMGRLAAELVVAAIDGTGGGPERVTVPARLIPRGSGELPPPA
ncbi:LacI family DNA-binding transcriptional regulator [Jiangella asiatica]|uniref:LacI family transcriptional regulator n=1 Tax=Jiangella asiatica TaxID=2530372 RepID=A0A4R5DH35_9ACTN|nr:LacI family DNA-binding transcriptional regulator [Jiangella asiatica]TDE11230.1 LacI family transcriptional regulator [Jiangella asiatica]